MNFKRLTTAWLCLSLCGLAQLGVAASKEIEEIIVTATKREVSIQDVPIAISAFSGEDLESRGVQDMYGLQEVSPSVTVYTSSSESNGGTIRIRGVGTTGVNPGLEAAVGTFIDGVYRSRAGLAFSDLTDVDRIEVLRGPQGTLFGKNTSAGVLHIITKKPEFEQATMLSLSAGDYNSIRLQASNTGALIDDVLAYRLAFSYNNRDGYLEDLNTGSEYGNRDRYTIKAQLLWTPVDSVSSRFIFDYTDKDEECCPARTDRITYGVQRLSSTSRSYLSVGEDPPDVLAEMTERLGFRQEEANPGKDNVDVALNFKPYETVEEWGLQNETVWDITDNLTLTSITAYREFDTERGVDVDFTAADVLQPQNTVESFENFSQEFQFTWSAGSVDFLAGAYFYTEDIVTDEHIRLSTQGGEYLARIQTGLLDKAFGLEPGTIQTVPGVYPVLGDTGTTIGSALGSWNLETGAYFEVTDPPTERGNHAPGDGYFADYKQETDGWSLFTHNVWHVTDRFDMTFGLRFSNETKKGQARINGIDPVSGTEEELLTLALTDTFNEDHCNGFGAVGSFCNNVSWKDENEEEEWTGTIKASYALTEDFNIYGSISRGYKAGGFNLDQQSIELDAFATNIASGGEARFLSPSLLGGTDPEWAAYKEEHGIPNSAGLTAFECGQGRGTSNPELDHLDCALFDDDHSFDPEFVDAFELGFKAQFLDGALSTNVALFYSEYDDFQLNTYTGTGFLISNTDEMISKGAEFESTWFISEGVIFTFGVTYADARYGDDLNAKGQSELSLYEGLVANQGNPDVYKRIQNELEDFQSLENLEGRQITHAPYWQGSTSLFVEQPVGRLFAYGNLNVAYRGSHNTGSDLKPQKDVSGEALLNLQLGLRSEDNRWDVKLWARNLTDNQVKTIVFNSVFQNDGDFHAFVNTPRMIGLTLTSHL